MRLKSLSLKVKVSKNDIAFSTLMERFLKQISSITAYLGELVINLSSWHQIW